MSQQSKINRKIVKVWEDLPIDKVRPFKGQPRSFFDKKTLQALAKSIECFGQCEPVMVIAVREDPKHTHQLIDGERRYRSAKEAGEKTLFAIEIEIMDTDETRQIPLEDKLYLISSVANVAKETHQPLEFSRILLRAKKIMKCSNRELANIYGQDIKTIQNSLGYLELPMKVQELMSPRKGEDQEKNLPLLKPTIAKELRGYAAPLQISAALQAVKEGWTRSEVTHFLREESRAKGIAKQGVRTRKPSDDWDLIQSGLMKIDERLLVMLDTPRSSIEHILRVRGKQAKKTLLADLNRSIRQLIGFKDFVQAINLKAA